MTRARTYLAHVFRSSIPYFIQVFSSDCVPAVPRPLCPTALRAQRLVFGRWGEEGATEAYDWLNALSYGNHYQIAGKTYLL